MEPAPGQFEPYMPKSRLDFGPDNPRQGDDKPSRSESELLMSAMDASDIQEQIEDLGVTANRDLSEISPDANYHKALFEGKENARIKDARAKVAGLPESVRNSVLGIPGELKPGRFTDEETGETRYTDDLTIGELEARKAKGLPNPSTVESSSGEEFAWEAKQELKDAEERKDKARMLRSEADDEDTIANKSRIDAVKGATDEIRARAKDNRKYGMR